MTLSQSLGNGATLFIVMLGSLFILYLFLVKTKLLDLILDLFKSKSNSSGERVITYD